MTPQQLFDELPARFLPEAAGKTRATFQFELTGEGGGRWWVRIADSTCEVGTGPVDRPHVTLTADAGDYVKIRTGQLNPVAATMNGLMKVEGQYGLALKFPKMFRSGS